MMPPIDALHPEVTGEGSGSRLWPWTMAGVVALGGMIVTAVVALHTPPAWLSFASAFLCLVALACCAPAVTDAAARLGFTMLRTKRNVSVSAEIAILNLRRAVARN